VVGVAVLGALPQVMSGAPAAASGADMTLAMVLAVVLAVLVPEPLAVLPPLPVVGVSVGLAVSLGDGVGLDVSLGDGVGLTEALADGDAELEGVGVGVQATAGVASGVFFLDAMVGWVGLTPSGGCHSPGLARPVAAVGACWWPGEVTELVGVITASCIRFSVNTPTITTATTAATANAGLSQAAAGPRRSAVLPAGVRPLRCAPVDGCRLARWLSSQKKDSSQTDSRIRYSRSQSAARPGVERADRRECDR
jgi:hypothetical protein